MISGHETVSFEHCIGIDKKIDFRSGEVQFIITVRNKLLIFTQENFIPINFLFQL